VSISIWNCTWKSVNSQWTEDPWQRRFTVSWKEHGLSAGLSRHCWVSVGESGEWTDSYFPPLHQNGICDQMLHQSDAFLHSYLSIYSTRTICGLENSGLKGEWSSREQDMEQWLKSSKLRAETMTVVAGNVNSHFTCPTGFPCATLPAPAEWGLCISLARES
jgi:hypothetical protein